MKNNVNFFLISTVSVASLAACSPISNTLNRGISTLNWEAGKSIDEGNYGDPTLNNTLAQLAYADQGGLIMDLSRKFEKDVPAMINFEFNKAGLDAEARKVLAQQADWMRQFPQLRFKVYGHTDLVGSDAYNKRLGLRRANATVAYLVSRGVSIDRLEAVVSQGETQPLIVTEGRERRNRRTVTEVSGFARGYVGEGMDGKYANLVYQTYIIGGAPTTGTITSVKAR
ncbi:MAG: OmpA family protein [Rhodobacteraceae bacterium]|nr:OmpA family protein [Paracoccaceae bacterium]